MVGSPPTHWMFRARLRFPMRLRCKNGTVERRAEARIKGVRLGNAEAAAKVAAGQIEEMRRNELGLLAEFNAVTEDPSLATGLAGTAIATTPIDTTTMLAQLSTISAVGASQPLWMNRIRYHRAPKKSQDACVGYTPVPKSTLGL